MLSVLRKSMFGQGLAEDLLSYHLYLCVCVYVSFDVILLYFCQDRILNK